MSRYGVLGRYLPVFGRIVGQMQHDLFHVYTVDEHILMVIRNLRRFRIPRFDHEYPFLSQLMQEFDRPEVLYLAALFHDVAKGRGGDRSTLGRRTRALRAGPRIVEGRWRARRLAGRAPPRDVVHRRSRTSPIAR
jgi:UTP:GlnB (protein PII) uridylyltransferase